MNKSKALVKEWSFRVLSKTKANRKSLICPVLLSSLLLLFALQRAVWIPENSELYLLPAIAIAAVVATYLNGSAGLAIALPTILAAALILYLRLPVLSETNYHLFFALLGYSAVGSVVVALFMGRERTKRENLEWMSAVDSLTEVYNHRYFQQRLNEEIARADRTKSPLALVFVDIDYFKEYNDQNGHVMGDIALKKTAAFLNDITRVHDIVCRYGGDEFVIILPECDAANAAVISERLVRAYNLLNLPGKVDGKINLTLSLGISDYPAYSRDLEELIHQADRALYMAKEAGRNNVQVFRETASESLFPVRKGFCYDSCKLNLAKGYKNLLEKEDLQVKPASEGKRGNGGGNGSEKNLFIGLALGAGHDRIDPVRLSACLSELNLH